MGREKKKNTISPITLDKFYKNIHDQIDNQTQIIRTGKAEMDADYNPTLHPYRAMLCTANGMTIKEVAKSFGVNTRIISRWRKLYPEFDEALSIGKDKMALEVTSSLYNLAVGNCEEVTIQTVEDKATGEERQMKTVKHLPPNIRAIEKILGATKPEVWEGEKKPTITDVVSSLSTFYDINVVQKAKRLKNKEALLIEQSMETSNNGNKNNDEKPKD